MRKIETMFSGFAETHRTFGNRTCHRIGIPLLVIALLGLLARVRVGSVGQLRIDLGFALIVLASVYYFVLEWRLAIPLALAASILYLGARPLPTMFLFAVFVTGGVLEFIGHHVFEKNRPAFARNVFHILIGPLWILNDLIPVVRDRNPEQSSLQ